MIKISFKLILWCFVANNFLQAIDYEWGEQELNPGHLSHETKSLRWIGSPFKGEHQDKPAFRWNPVEPSNHPLSKTSLNQIFTVIITVLKLKWVTLQDEEEDEKA